MSIPEANPSRSAEEAVRARILAVDYGRKRLGLALSDEMHLTAHPFLVLTRSNRTADFRRLRQLCRENGVVRIIVGYPLHLTGETGEMAQEAARFATRLQRELGLLVELLDERLTSWEAEQSVSAPVSRRRGELKDDIAAAILLREYLDRQNSQKFPEGNNQKCTA